jgi:hypothetical protein
MQKQKQHPVLATATMQQQQQQQRLKAACLRPSPLYLQQQEVSCPNQVCTGTEVEQHVNQSWHI